MPTTNRGRRASNTIWKYRSARWRQRLATQSGEGTSGLVGSRGRFSLLQIVRRICREQPIHVVREFAQSHSTCIWHALGASWYRWYFDRTSDDQCCSDDRFCLSFQWIHYGLPLCLTPEDFRFRPHRRGQLPTIVTTTVGQRGKSPSDASNAELNSSGASMRLEGRSDDCERSVRKAGHRVYHGRSAV